MATGRPRKASEVHKQSGAYKINPKRENKREPKPKSQAPPKPDCVKSDAIANKKWISLCKLLDEIGLLANTDGELLELFCITFSQYRRLLVQVNTSGFTLISKDGDGVTVKRNPIMVEYKAAADMLRRLIPEFGLSPASRTRLVAVTAEDRKEDPFQAWLKRSGGLN